MAIVVNEVHGKSEAGAIGADGSRTVTRQFHVYDDEAAVTLDDALAAAGLPSEPSEGSAGDTVSTSSGNFYYWGTRSFQRVLGHDDQWILSYEYVASVSEPSGGVENEKSGGVRSVTRGAYRRNPTQPDPNEVGGTMEDIGGEPIDSGGVKTSFVHSQATLTIRTFSANEPEIVDFEDKVGKRNNAWYQGGDQGAVLFVGARFSKNTSINMWVTEYEFAFDSQTYHADQVAKTGAQGEVVTAPIGDGVDGSTAAVHVYWVQPFETTDFSNLP